MGKVQELYDSLIRPLAPSERLQLARLILDDLAPAGNAVDVRDEWGDDDMTDVAAFSTRHGDALELS